MSRAAPITDPRLAARLRVWPRVAAAIVFAISCVVLLGWTLEFERLKRVAPGLVAMNPMTAVSFISLAIGLAANSRRHVTRACAIVPGVVGLLILGRYLFGWQTEVDRLLFTNALASNVMAPTTAFNFVLSSVALWLTASRHPRRIELAHWISLAAALVSLLALTGYGYGVEKLYRLATFIAMAVHTAIAFLIFASGVLALNPELGVTSLVASSRSGGGMLRRLLLPITAAPLAMGWLILRGQRSGIYDEAFAFTVMVVGMIAFLTAMLWRSASQMDAEDVARVAGEAALREAHAGLEDTVRERTGAWQQTVDGIRVELRELTAAAEDILASSSVLATSATEAAASVAATTVTFEEVQQTARVAARGADMVAATAQKAVQVSGEGNAATRDAIARMELIRGEMSSMGDRMNELNEQTRAIGDIIAAVDEIADQSSLLAVNAAIEAAAAGAHGKGFAVVAQEVKYLSDQSRAATKRVRSILGEIQKAAGAAVMTTVQASGVVETGVAAAARAGDAIRSLEINVGGAAQAAAEIATSSQQQLSGVAHVGHAMEQIKAASDDNVAQAHQLEDAARRLSELGQRLKHLAERHRG